MKVHNRLYLSLRCHLPVTLDDSSLLLFGVYQHMELDQTLTRAQPTEHIFMRTKMICPAQYRMLVVTRSANGRCSHLASKQMLPLNEHPTMVSGQC